MFDISVTFAVLKLEMTSEERFSQSKNMPNIFSTFVVLKLVRSSEDRFLQFQNMCDISVTSAVFKYLRPVISFKPVQSLKNSFNEVGVYVLKLSSKMTFLIVLTQVSDLDFEVEFIV